MINVLIVEPNELPYEKTIPNTLKAKQEIVNGYIQCTSLLADPDVVLICNEEGKINNLPYNRDIGHDIIAGTFIIAGDDIENGDFKSLTKEQVEKYKIKFDKQSIKNTESKIEAILLKNSFFSEQDINE
ncbi:MAG: DUF3846 domain-containing protein [Bacilli bacterium]|nr:DUF3846 domain-containing protein [Bacilli bacterium]